MTSDPRIAYFVPDFPSQTHAFFWRELLAVGEQTGEAVPVVSTREPPADACLHPFAADARTRTTYLLSKKELLAGLLGGVLAPIGSLRGLARVLKLTGLSPAARLGAWLAGLRLSRWARARGVTHVHVHSAANAAVIAMVANAVSGLRYSIVLHGDPEVYGENHAAKMGHAACVIAVTNPLAARVREEGWVDPDRLFVVTMGVDTDTFAPDGTPKDEPPMLVTVARLNNTKGIQYAFEALARLRDEGQDFRFSVLGEGPYRGALAKEIDRLSLGDRVTLHGTASQPEVLDALRRASVFSLTSFGMGEAAPVSVMEAMAVGTPVVVSRIGGSPDMIDSGSDGILTEQEDVESIAAAFRTLLGSPETRAAMAAAGRDRAVRDFDYRVLAGRVVEILRACSNGGPR